MKPVDLDLEFPCEKIFNYKFNLKTRYKVI